MKKYFISALVISVFAALLAPAACACTNILVSKGASADGSVYITYAADAPYMHRLIHIPAAEHEEGSFVDVTTWQYVKISEKVRQVKYTHGVVGLMNDHQVAIAETTTSGRKELVNPDGLLDYGSLMILALQRAKSAREAISIIDALCSEYGYKSSGESFAISDKNEVWLMEIIGKGPGNLGANWVAARVPDGYITAIANMSRISRFPKDDPENWKYSEDVVEFAREQGFYSPEDDGEFSWKRAYFPNPSIVTHRACATRVWSVYRRAAPSQEFDSTFHRGEDPFAEDYPLFIKPDEKLTTTGVMALMRDHFEGTPYDMTKGISAGPFGSPYRYKNLVWQYKGETYCWERPISTQQSGFVMVAQSRSWLPDPVGGVYWYSPDNAFTACFMPLYCGITRLPKPFVTGTIEQFDWNSGWWVFNLVSNLTYDRYSRIIPDVQKVQKEKESEFLALQPAVDMAAAKLAESNETLFRKYITDYSVNTAVELFNDWKELCTFIITKHNDGYVYGFKPPERAKGVNYPGEWLERVVAEEGDALRINEPEEK